MLFLSRLLHTVFLYCSASCARMSNARAPDTYANSCKMHLPQAGDEVAQAQIKHQQHQTQEMRLMLLGRQRDLENKTKMLQVTQQVAAEMCSLTTLESHSSVAQVAAPPALVASAETGSGSSARDQRQRVMTKASPIATQSSRQSFRSKLWYH